MKVQKMVDVMKKAIGAMGIGLNANKPEATVGLIQK